MAYLVAPMVALFFALAGNIFVMIICKLISINNSKIVYLHNFFIGFTKLKKGKYVCHSFNIS